MTRLRDSVDAICAALPGAVWADPADGKLPSWKVGDKIFASLGHTTPGVSVKTPDVETASMLIEAGEAERAPYFHKSWVRLPETTDTAVLRHRLLTSYDIVRAGLPKKLRDALPEREA